MIFPVPPDGVLHHWPTASAQLERAFNLCEADSVAAHLQPLLQDQEQLWHINGAAWAITRVCQGKRGRIFEFVALAGDGLADWHDEFFKRAEGWAKAHGCVIAVFTGRHGWQRALPDYRRIRVTMKKEL